ncbi:flavodoxin [Bacillus sp. FJAT-45350]|uniref:flavodoxin n=1 Tax=Bacillus sp. FJAT-45350 TaxID=2011014 RepID=UPI000BB7B668|nr:flavodoxin [Bacillus sp. FJAT-45350]
MSRALLIYASMSGNTESVADLVEVGLKNKGVKVFKKEVMECDTSILEGYDAVLLGAYTWGDGELPDEFLDFYEEMAGIDLSGKKFAIFGTGDTSYPEFCGAVDLLEAMVAEKNGVIVLPGLKIELSPDEDEETCKLFGENFAEKIA